MTSRARTACAGIIVPLILMIAAAGCEAPNPDTNTPTSGRLVVYVDEMYAPLIRTLADSFMVRSPNAKIVVQPVPARMAVQELFNSVGRDTSKADTGTTYAIVIGRELLPDEKDAATKGGLDTKDYIIAYDGLAVAVPGASPLRYTTLENLRRALGSPAPMLSMLDSTAPAEPLRFLLPDQNSSTYPAVHALLGDSAVTAPARYFSTGDSVLGAVAAGEGIGLIGWTPAHEDSATVKTLALGFIDSLGGIHPPAIVHPTSLVTGAYPIRQTLSGYTFSTIRSLAAGFLAWLANAQDAQYYLANHGMQPENVKIRIVLPDREE